MIERWKAIIGFEGLYEVSELGKVKRLAYSKKSKLGNLFPVSEHILKPAKDGKGYLGVTLFKNGTPFRKKVHRLVAEAFVSNPFLLPQINHIDGDKTNNNVGNLEWCDNRHNIRHAYALGLLEPKRGEKNASHKLTQEAVDFIKSVYEPRTIRLGAQALARAFGVDRHTIERIARGDSWKISEVEEEE